MALVKSRKAGRWWDPWREIDQLRRELDRLWGMDRWFDRTPGRGDETGLLPAVDLYDAGDRLVAKVDLPGVAPGDVEVTVEQGRLLTVRAARPVEEVKEDAYLWCERPAGRFARTIELPVDVDVEQVKATLANGVLQVVLPKSTTAAPRRVAVTVER